MNNDQPCGNTQTEIDRDQDVKHTIEQLEEHQVAVELMRQQKKDFIEKLMNYGSAGIKKFSGGHSWINAYSLNDAVQDIPADSALWSSSFSAIYDSDPDKACDLIINGELPTKLEKIVKSAVEALADEVLGL